MKPADFDFLSTLIKTKSGIVLTPGKAYLLENRLMPVARKLGLESLEDLALKLKTHGSRDIEAAVIEAMTTNESFFFRDGRPFDLFRDQVMTTILENRKGAKHFRIWCAAASTGQEPYTLAMILSEMATKLSGWRYDILGTDLSSDVLEKAKAGFYTQFEVQRGLPVQLLVKYFKQEDGQWRIDQGLRRKVDYRQFNLLDNPASFGQFDIVFCRNVLIYFDQETKRAILERIAKQMPSDGVLFLGGAETVLGVTEAFKPIPGQRGIYAVNT